VSVVIVNWNAGADLARAVESLVAYPPSVPWEVTIVDNASTDDSVERAVAAVPAATVIRNATNRGLAAANNQGMAASAAEAILICNPDVLFTAGAVDALIAVLTQRPRAAQVIPRLRHPDGTLHTSAGDLPTVRDALLGRQAARRTGRPVWWDDWAHDEECRIGRGHEAAYLVRRDAVRDVGGQDERFVLDWEGVDWAARFTDAGWEIWFTPAAEVVHLGGTSIRQVPVRWVVSSHRGMYRYFAKRSPWFEHPVLALVVAARAAAKLAGMVVGVTGYERGQRGPNRRARRHGAGGRALRRRRGARP
jgi:GT2 family glycosyltransferase